MVVQVHIPTNSVQVSVHFQARDFKKTVEDFYGGQMIKNPPAKIGDMGSIPGPGRSHKPQGI